MRPGASHWLTSPPSGRCTVCGQSLRHAGKRYWITAHPDGVHEDCRAWEEEPFPFGDDLRELRWVARSLRFAWGRVLVEGRWLSQARRSWPAGARRVVGAWFVRKSRLQHHLSRVRDRLGR